MLESSDIPIIPVLRAGGCVSQALHCVFASRHTWVISKDW